MHVHPLGDMGNERADRIGQRHQGAANALRQRLEHRLHFFAQHAHGQPLKARGVDLIEHRHRQGHGHAIHDVGRLKAVLQRVGRALVFEGFREEIKGDVTGAVPHELFAAEFENRRLDFFAVLAPTLKSGHGDNFRRNQLIIELEHVLIVHQHILPARLGFHVLDFIYEAQIHFQKLAVGVDFPRHQTLADENFAGFFWIDGAVVNAAARVDHQAIQRHGFKRHHLPGFALPVRVVVCACHQMCRQLLNPLRLDGGNRARVHTGGLGELGRHHPFQAFLFLCGVVTQQFRQMKLHRTWRGVIVALDGFGANIGDEAGEQRTVDALVAGGFRHVLCGCGDMHAEGGTHLRQLHMHIPPLAHAQR